MKAGPQTKYWRKSFSSSTLMDLCVSCLIWHFFKTLTLHEMFIPKVKQDTEKVISSFFLKNDFFNFMYIINNI